MNISKAEQRVLHALAQGGAIRHQRTGAPDGKTKVTDALCVTREGHILAGFDLSLFNRLRQRGLIASTGGRPYRLTPLGRRSVRAQLDNR